MTFVWVVVCAVISVFFCAGVFEQSVALAAALFGALFGYVLSRLSKLNARLQAAEKELRRLSLVPAPTVSTSAQRPAPPIAPAAPPALVEPAPSPPIVPPPPVVEIPVPVATPIEAKPKTVSSPERGEPLVVVRPATPDPVSLAFARIKRWFTEGNVPVKVGVLVLLLGVGALLKYATDAGWLHVAIEFRLAGIAIVALAALVFAWRKRESHPTFSLSLQGGAVGILILTIYAAFRIYSLLPASIAFAMLIVIVAGTGVLAVAQNAIALAVLAIVAGFAAPILVATGAGSHVELFTYYAVLNAMIFVIAWLRPWRALNLLGFAFTFGIGTAWGVLQYRPEQFGTTEPFLLLFFAFYLFIPIFYARRLDANKRDLIDTALVFGTPLVAFSLQTALLKADRMPLAWSAVIAAAIYAGLAAVEIRRLGLRLLGESHALLALGFATLAVPLALSAHATACAWALEGAALVWVGFRQQRRLPRWIGYALQGMAGLSLLSEFNPATTTMPILNGNFFGASLIVAAAIVSARQIFARDAKAPLSPAFLLWAWVWVWAAFGADIERFIPREWAVDAWLVVISVTGVVCAEVFRRWHWPAFSVPALVAFVLAALIALASFTITRGPLEQWGAAAWLVWLLAAVVSLLCLHRGENPFVYIVQTVLQWTIAVVLGSEFAHLVDHAQLDIVWIGISLLAPFALLFWLVLVRTTVVRWPDSSGAERLRQANLSGLALLLALAWIAGLFIEGNPSPLPFVPVFNPLELAQLGFLLMLLVWYQRAASEGNALTSGEWRSRILAAAGVVLLTAITLRGAHFVAGVPWSDELWSSPVAQAALSIVWTIAGIAAMLLGKWRGSRAVWIGGGILMGVVIVKLLLIDRQHLHDLAAIVGVLIVGILLVGVGYFAPVPPRAQEKTA